MWPQTEKASICLSVCGDRVSCSLGLALRFQCSRMTLSFLVLSAGTPGAVTVPEKELKGHESVLEVSHRPWSSQADEVWDQGLSQDTDLRWQSGIIYL